MKRLAQAVASIWEPLLWTGFLLLSILSLGDDAPDAAPTVAGLFALAAIGFRATRTEKVTDSEAVDGTT